MKDSIVLTISNQQFNLTSAEAKFLAEHLRTAVAQPNLALNFSHLRSEEHGRVALSRNIADVASMHTTDC